VLATSPGFSILFDVRRPDDGPKVDLPRWSSCGIPSAWRSPTMRCLGGNIPSQPRTSLPGLPPCLGHQSAIYGEIETHGT
jgi:hypothetical protein